MFFLTRSSGILLPFPLPGRWGIGDLGPGPDRLSTFSPLGPKNMADTPLSETDGRRQLSVQLAFRIAGNHLFISPDDLLECGLLTAADTENCLRSRREGRLSGSPCGEGETLARAFKGSLPQRSTKPFYSRTSIGSRLCALSAMKQRFGGLSWNQWPDELKLRDERS